MRLEHIRYLDHFQDEGGWKDTGSEELEPLYCDSVGWVVAENGIVVRLAPNTSDSDDKQDRECGAMVLLKCCIVSRTVLRE